jgi:hypothetical protein
MKTTILTLFNFLLVFSCSSQEILKAEVDTNLFNIFSNLQKENISIESNSNYFAKIILLNSDVEISDNDEGHDKKQYFYLLIADYGEKPEGTLFKSILLNHPNFEIKNIKNDIFEISLTFVDDKNNIVTKKILCNSTGEIKE